MIGLGMTDLLMPAAGRFGFHDGARLLRPALAALYLAALPAERVQGRRVGGQGDTTFGD